MKRALRRLAPPLGAYLLLEWLFSYMTVAEGLVSPRGAPHLWVIAIGMLYLTLRLVVRLVLPGVLVFTLVGGALKRWSGPASSRFRPGSGRETTFR